MHLFLALALLIGIQEEYLSQEEANPPPAGYSVKVQYDKTDALFSAELHPHGSREANTPMVMPPCQECPFCFSGDVRVFRSMSDRVLLVPGEHVSHWFSASEELQNHLLKSAVDLASKIEKHFPGALSSNNAYLFELHVGSAGAQTVPHLHLRFASGPHQGRLTPEQWNYFTMAILCL